MSISDTKIIVGRVCGVSGVRGWVKVISYTAPKENIFNYSPWEVFVHGEWREMPVVAGRSQGKGLTVLLGSYSTPESARELIGGEIAVARSQLPSLAEGEFYWADLIGLDVLNTDGITLGKITDLYETGSNDVLVVKSERERHIPFIRNDVVVSIDLEQRQIKVDWDPEF